MKRSTIVGVLNGIANPLALCLGLPLLEGAAAPDFASATGFWGQFALAVAIAEVLGMLPGFHRFCARALSVHGFKPGTAAAAIAGTVVAATVSFMVIGAGEVILTSGIGTVEGVPYFFRWLKLMIVGWPFVIVGGLLLDIPVGMLADALCGAAEKPAASVAAEDCEPAAM